MKQKLKEIRGITLIALIITIIVLLILAVVAINAIKGDGIIGHAKNARNKYLDAQKNELDLLDEYFMSIERANGITVNVKDYGAVGDGKTDDKEAILKAFDYALQNLPATVYFPEGEYGLANGGMYINLPLGATGLTVKGDGAEKSVIKYLENWTTNGTWVALRLQPESTPSNENEYLKNILIRDLGVYDTDPVNHAWNTDKGDAATEETHGFDIQYCINAMVENCKIDSVGDEAIDMVFCINSVIRNNKTINSPGAGNAGGAISVGDGCRNVNVVNNIVDGTINGKTNFGIAVEALVYPVQQVYINNNTVKNINGNGINIGAPKGTIDTVVTDNNTITDCTVGIKIMGTGKKTNISIKNSNINNITTAFNVEGSSNESIVIDGFEINNVSDKAIRLASIEDGIIKNGTMKNLQNQAIFNAGNNTIFDSITIDGVGLTDTNNSAIDQYTSAGSCTVKGVTIRNCKNKIGIRNVANISNTNIEQAQIEGNVSIQNATNITGGSVTRQVTGLKNNGIIDGLAVNITENMGTTPAIYLLNSNCTVKNCTVAVPSGYAISEGGSSADYNQVFDNVCIGGSVNKVGANSVFTNNEQK